MRSDYLKRHMEVHKKRNEFSKPEHQFYNYNLFKNINLYKDLYEKNKNYASSDDGTTTGRNLDRENVVDVEREQVIKIEEFENDEDDKILNQAYDAMMLQKQMLKMNFEILNYEITYVCNV